MAIFLLKITLLYLYLSVKLTHGGARLAQAPAKRPHSFVRFGFLDVHVGSFYCFM